MDRRATARRCRRRARLFAARSGPGGVSPAGAAGLGPRGCSSDRGLRRGSLAPSPGGEDGVPVWTAPRSSRSPMLLRSSFRNGSALSAFPVRSLAASGGRYSPGIVAANATGARSTAPN